MGGTTAKSCLIERRRAASSPTRSRSPACTASRRARGSRCRCRRSISSRSAPAAAASPASTSSVCSRSVPSRRAPIPARRATAAAAREPAVTDADLALGMLDAGYFLGGDMPLDLAAQRRRAGAIADGARPAVERHRRGHPRARQPEHGRRGAHARRRAGRRPARRHAARLRRRRAGPRLRRRRAARVAAA